MTVVSLIKYNFSFRTVINVFLFLTQMGFCCVYFVFVAANLHDVVKHYWIDISMHWYLLLMLVPMVLLNWVKSLKYLTPASLFASIITVTGLAITFIYMLQGLPSISTMKMFSSWEQLPLYFGVAIYAFEGIGVVSKKQIVYICDHLFEMSTLLRFFNYLSTPYLVTCIICTHLIIFSSDFVLILESII